MVIISGVPIFRIFTVLSLGISNQEQAPPYIKI